MVECWKNHVGPARSLKVWGSRLPMRHSSKTLQVCSGSRHPSLGNRGVWDVVGEVKPTQFSPIQFTSLALQLLEVVLPQVLRPFFLHNTWWFRAAWVGLLLWLGGNLSIFPQYVNSLKQVKYYKQPEWRDQCTVSWISLWKYKLTIANIYTCTGTYTSWN